MSDQFPAFDFLTGVFPTWTPCQYEAEMALQSVVVPMLVLINNEKKYSNSVDVLDQLDRPGQGGVVGYQYTCYFAPKIPIYLKIVKCVILNT